MKKLLIAFLLWLPTATFGQSPEQHYKIYDVKNQKSISLDELISQTKNIDVLFFGEEHNDSIGHILEFELFQKLSQAYPKTALTLEMFHTDTQPVLNEYLAGVISEKNFIKEARAWNNYKDYRPMIELAKSSHLNVIAGNAAARYSNAVSKSGLDALKNFPESSLAYLPPLPVDTATGRYYDKFIETLGGHSMGAMKIYQTQNLWDATMSWSIARYYKANKGAKIFQVNGRFHSDEKLGTLAKLKKLVPKLQVSNISCFSGDDFASPDWNKHQHLGDYIILTDPSVKRTF
ncbi:ChaN family lipoprotein [Pedobacter caeni]|uniref:Uncharacterized iron-regulated protein n=1 Tax=Pedobacter caeni TaxID=288992 RepID=A0A1M5GB14_9SPHI|nr:ChaN family lipoprotein [Pedobacter caeni]SHG00868.1 Uncharacterized iron-regulated protein [Pedobacter caeni]